MNCRLTLRQPSELIYYPVFCRDIRMTSDKLDKTDRKLLNELQRDSRQSVAELALKAGLSPSACHRRIKLLEEAGAIENYTAVIDRAALGLSNEFFVE